MERGTKKLCDRDKLEEFSNMLDAMIFGKTKFTMDNLLSLQSFYDIHIMDRPRESINDIKREIYDNMKMATNEKDRQMYYELYQQIKANGKSV